MGRDDSKSKTRGDRGAVSFQLTEPISQLK